MFGLHYQQEKAHTDTLEIARISRVCGQYFDHGILITWGQTKKDMYRNKQASQQRAFLCKDTLPSVREDECHLSGHPSSSTFLSFPSDDFDQNLRGFSTGLRSSSSSVQRLQGRATVVDEQVEREDHAETRGRPDHRIRCITDRMGGSMLQPRLEFLGPNLNKPCISIVWNCWQPLWQYKHLQSTSHKFQYCFASTALQQ